MKFIHPQFLWALSVLAIPIALHLFNFRRFKRVLFPNLRFLREVQIQSKTRQQIKKWLVLIARCLMLSFLVLAFAQPFLPGASDQSNIQGHALSIYIDNSFSMNAVGEDGQLLEQAKAKARDLVKSYGETDRFQLLSNDFEGRHQRFQTKERFLSLLDELTLSPKTRALAEVINRQRELLEKEKGQVRRMAFQISDFQKSTSDFASIEADTSIQLYLTPIQADEGNNISIDSAWLNTPYVKSGEGLSLSVLLTNKGNQDLDQGTLTLKLNDAQKGLSNFSLRQGQQIKLEIPFKLDQSEWVKGVLEIQDYPVVFDDKLYFTLKAEESLPVLILQSDSSIFLNGVFQTDSYFDLDQEKVDKLDYSILSRQSLVVLNELTEYSSGLQAELKSFVEGGGSLYIIPADTLENELNPFLQNLGLGALGSKSTKAWRANRVLKDHPIFKDILEEDLENASYPEGSAYYPFQASSNTEELIGMDNGNALLSSITTGKGRVYLQTVPLSPQWSSFTRHYLFPSVMLRAGIYSKQVAPLYYVIGDANYIPVDIERKDPEELYELEGAGKSSIPELLSSQQRLQLSVGPIVEEAGQYALHRKDEKEDLAFFSFNYKRLESNMQFYTADEIKSLLPKQLKAVTFDKNPQTLGFQVKKLDEGTALWKACLLLALLFLVIEILLLRFLK